MGRCGARRGEAGRGEAGQGGVRRGGATPAVMPHSSLCLVVSQLPPTNPPPPPHTHLPKSAAGFCPFCQFCAAYSVGFFRRLFRGIACEPSKTLPTVPHALVPDDTNVLTPARANSRLTLLQPRPCSGLCWLHHPTNRRASDPSPALLIGLVATAFGAAQAVGLLRHAL